MVLQQRDQRASPHVSVQRRPDVERADQSGAGVVGLVRFGDRLLESAEQRLVVRVEQQQGAFGNSASQVAARDLDGDRVSRRIRREYSAEAYQEVAKMSLPGGLVGCPDVVVTKGEDGGRGGRLGSEGCIDDAGEVGKKLPEAL